MPEESRIRIVKNIKTKDSKLNSSMRLKPCVLSALPSTLTGPNKNNNKTR